MATLAEAFNPDFSRKASVLAGNDNRVTVEVEDSIDAEFWGNILSTLCPEKEFHFNPYHTVLDSDNETKNVTGKSRIVKHSGDFNKWHIGCIDSDYDWLLYNEDGYAQNKFLIQTYAYSIENLLCAGSTLNSFCSEITEEIADCNFEDYVNRLSSIIAPLLVWSAFLFSNGCQDFTPTSWRAILNCNQDNLESMLDEIGENVCRELKRFESMHRNEIEAKESCEKVFRQKKNFSEKNAYLFVRGHDLFYHVAHSLMGPVVSQLRKIHYDKLHKIENPEERKTAMVAYQAKSKSLNGLLYNNYRFKKSEPIYNKIASDVKSMWA